LLNPQVIVEVMSPTTASRHRGVKWLAYQTIPTLGDYLAIASDRRFVEHHQGGADGSWTTRTVSTGAVTLGSGVRLEIDDLYEQTGR
jgi:Uma2 family endonuclease